MWMHTRRLLAFLGLAPVRRAPRRGRREASAPRGQNAHPSRRSGRPHVARHFPGLQRRRPDAVRRRLGQGRSRLEARRQGPLCPRSHLHLPRADRPGPERRRQRPGRVRRRRLAGGGGQGRLPACDGVRRRGVHAPALERPDGNDAAGHGHDHRVQHPRQGANHPAAARPPRSGGSARLPPVAGRQAGRC